MKPIISVVMATFCRARIISDSIDSILNQTFTNFELIIIDDGSNDGTKEIIERFASIDHRIRWVRYDTNSGTPAIRYNQGVSLASGDYIAFMFDDDVLYPDALGTLYNFMLDNIDCGMVYGQADYIDIRNNSYIGKSFGDDWDFDRLKRQGNFLCNLSVLIKKSVIDDVGCYDEAPLIKRLCDWDLWIRIGEKYKVKRIRKTVGKVNAFHEDSIGITVDLNMSNIREHQSNKERMLALKNYWSSKKKIIFVTHGHDAALQRWRIDYLMEAINNLNGKWVASKIDIYLDKLDSLYNADIIVLYRFIIKDIEIENFLKGGKTVIYDIDDYILDETCKYNNPSDIIFSTNWINLSKKISISTPQLLEKIDLKEKSFIRKNAINISDFKRFTQTKKITNNEIRIGWLGGLGRNENNDFILELLKDIAKNKSFTFVYFGKTLDFFNSLKDIKNIKIERKSYVALNRPYDFYNEIFSSNLDCVINPLVQDTFFECKSELKYIECGILGIPLITSPRGIFKDIIKHRHNGFLADTKEEFKNEIDFIFYNPKEVAKISYQAYRDVSTNYNIIHERDRYILMLDSMLNDNTCQYLKPESFLVGINISKPTSVLGEIFGAKKILQSFYGEHDNLSKVKILLATYMRNNKGSLVISLMTNPEDIESTVRKITLDCNSIEDNSWADFSFESIKKSKGVKYYIQINGVNSRSGHAVTAYYNANSVISGELFINRSKFKGSLCFKVYYG